MQTARRVQRDPVVVRDMEQSAGGRKPPFTYRMTTWLAAKTPHEVLDCVARCGGMVHYWTAREKRRNYLANLSSCAAFDATRPWRAFQNHALNIAELLKGTRDTSGALISRVTVHGRCFQNKAWPHPSDFQNAPIAVGSS